MRTRQGMNSRPPVDTGPVIPLDDAVSRQQRKELQRLTGGTPSRESRAMPGLAKLTRILAGPPGRYPGRVPWEIRMPKHHESTAATRGLYPWLAGRPLPQCGPVFGREIISGGLWCLDGWEQRKLGRVGDTGIFISGVIGSGKSAAAKIPGHPARRLRPAVRGPGRHPRRMGARRPRGRRPGAAPGPGHAGPAQRPGHAPPPGGHG